MYYTLYTVCTNYYKKRSAAQINYKYNRLWVERGIRIECLVSLYNCHCQVLRKV